MGKDHQKSIEELARTLMTDALMSDEDKERLRILTDAYEFTLIKNKPPSSETDGIHKLINEGMDLLFGTDEVYAVDGQQRVDYVSNIIWNMELPNLRDTEYLLGLVTKERGDSVWFELKKEMLAECHLRIKLLEREEEQDSDD